MNKLALAIVGLILATQLGFAQTPPGAPGPAPAQTPGQPSVAAKPALQTFDLDFSGGNPKELVSAIEKATGKPLNAIVPDEFLDVQIPTLKLRDVTVPQLFDALEISSQKRVQYVTGTYFTGTREAKQYQQMTVSYGFKTPAAGANAVWYFYYNKPTDLPATEYVCRFWQLGSLLKDYRVEDITTAIQTGWKLLGVAQPPTLKFHPETKLLIATGQTDQLAMIDSVLKELSPAAPTPVAPKSATVNTNAVSAKP